MSRDYPRGNIPQSDTLSISRNTNIRMPLVMLVGVIVFVFGMTANYYAIMGRFDRQDRKFEELKTQMWSSQQQVKFARQLERQNPMLKVPDPLECCSQSSPDRPQAAIAAAVPVGQ